MEEDKELSLKFLVNKFSKHAIEAEENRQRCILQFKENNPGEPIPSHMTGDFCIAKALEFICKEILRIEREYGRR